MQHTSLSMRIGCGDLCPDSAGCPEAHSRTFCLGGSCFYTIVRANCAPGFQMSATRRFVEGTGELEQTLLKTLLTRRHCTVKKKEALHGAGVSLCFPGICAASSSLYFILAHIHVTCAWSLLREPPNLARWMPWRKGPSQCLYLCHVDIRGKERWVRVLCSAWNQGT